MERSAAYAGIVGAVLFVLSGVLPGAFPAATSSSATLLTDLGNHHAALLASAWLALPAAAFILWFAYGLFDYLHEIDGPDRTLLQWGAAGAVIWSTLLVASSALQAATTLNPGNDLATLYVVDVILYVFSMGAFAMFAFTAANAGRRRGTLPGWLNAFGFLVFAVDLLYTLSILSTNPALSITGVGAMLSTVLSGLWVFVASFVLLASVPKTP